MPFATICPNCDARLTAPDTVLGKKVKCKKCDEPFVARLAAEPEDEEDDRPAKAAAGKRRPARDDDDEAPARKPSKARRPADDLHLRRESIVTQVVLPQHESRRQRDAAVLHRIDDALVPCA